MYSPTVSGLISFLVAACGVVGHSSPELPPSLRIAKDPHGVEIDNGTVQDRGLLRILLYGTTGSLPVGNGENTYTRGATLSEHCVEEHPQTGNHNDMVPSLSKGMLSSRCSACWIHTATRMADVKSSICDLRLYDYRNRNVDATSLITAEQIEN